MKVSINTIKQYINFELPPVDELVKRINEQLGGVEEVIDLGEKYKAAKIVRVVGCEKHPNADRLSVCKVDDGSGELIQVVCGAPNVRADMWAVWLPPESIVPATFGDAEPFKLGARELRGVVSHGMLAAADELAIGTDHDGILEINPNEWKPGDVVIKPGASFADTYGLNDYVIDIENKMFTHRPDLFGQLGVAREIAGILGHAFESPAWYTVLEEGRWKLEDGDILPLETFNEAGGKVPRVMFVAMKSVEIKPSPLWLRCALVAMGSKPINNIVDVTNYVMLLTAQPTHAYDYDKISGSRIGARMAKAGEKIKLLNDKTYELTEEDIVIADADGPIGLGGIMGGGESEVDMDTKTIILEVATFDMYAVRKSAMRHGVFTDALTRFNKGQSPLQNYHILNLLMMSIRDVSQAEQASEVFDMNSEESTSTVSVTDTFINERLGLKLDNAEIKNLLTNVEITVDTSNELEITPPFWRTDLEMPEDIVEEVGRLYGFGKLPRELPTRSTKPAANNPRLDAKQKIRSVLSRAGANEVLAYSFVHENVLKRAGQNSEKAYRLGNALSPDLQYYRLSIVPSLLDKTHMNIRAGYDEFVLFELGKGHHKEAVDEEGLPKEFDRIAGVYAAKNSNQKSGAPYFATREYVENLLSEFGFENVSYTKLSDYTLPEFDPFIQMLAPFDAERSAIITRGDMLVGVVGELSKATRSGFKLPARTAAFELFLSPFEKAVNQKIIYHPLSKYPSVAQDISLQVTNDVQYGDVVELVRRTLTSVAGGLAVTTTPLSIYQSDDDADKKTITLRFRVTSYDKTLRDDDVAPLLDAVAAAASGAFAAVRI